MSELKEKVSGECSYPSNVDNMVRNDTPFEGNDTSMPSANPIPGADGKVTVHKIKKTE